MIHLLTTVVLSLIAFITFNLGMDWINFGHGLHPVIALPIAAASFIGVCFINKSTIILE